MKELKKRGITLFQNTQNNNGTRIKNVIMNILLFLFCAAVLAFSVRGLPGNPTDLQINTQEWKENGPLELSPERGRYALLYSLAEDKSFSFSVNLARFASPDVGFTGAHYASLFAPGVSLLAIPGYLVGKYFGLAQVGSFAVIGLFAIFNVFLLRAIAVRLGAHTLAATIASIAFLLATPAFTYASTLYQHHISTFLILASVFLLVRYNSIFSLILIWMLCAFSISVDYPNVFMMLPIGILALGKAFFAEEKDGRTTVKISLLRLFTVISVAIPLALFLWLNYLSYDNPFQLAGGIEQVKHINSDGTPSREAIENLQKRLTEESYDANNTVLGFFKNRNMLNGFYTHFLSLDRGILFYTPVMLLGIGGLIIALRKKMPYVALLTAIMGFNIVLYSMWGDPYGGWAFGSRYLIPTYAILTIFLAFALTLLKKYNLFIILFFALFSYSVGVNTLGAITSSRNPPQVEALELEQITGREEKYTYQRNIDLLHADISKSYVYQTYAKPYISAWQYYMNLSVIIILVVALLLVVYKAKKEVVYEV